MADGSTTTYSLILPEIDGADGTWGISLNSNLSDLDSLLSGGTALTAITVTGTVTAGGVELGNNERIALGSESDGKLEIYEATGGNGVIEQTNGGDLWVQGENITLRNDDAETLISTGHTQAFMYWQGDTGTKGERFRTTETGIDVTGTVDCDGLKMDDGEYAQFGTGNDLQIFHNGTDSYIRDRGTGNLNIQTDGDRISIYDNANTRTMAQFNTDGAANLYWAGSSGQGLKLATTSTGIDVTGGITSDYLDLTGGKSTTTTGAICADQIRFSAEGTDEAKIYASVDGVNTSLFIQSNDDSGDKVRVVAGGTESLTVSDSGIDVTGGITSDYLDLTGGKSTTTTGEIALDKLKFSAMTDDEATIFAEVNGDVTTLVFNMQDDAHELIEHRIDGATPLKVTKTGIDVTGTVEADGFSGTGAVTVTDFIDDDSFATASATNVPTAESVKAYVDANAGGGETLAQTLAIGASTGGTDLDVSAGDDIVFSDSSKAIFQDSDGDPKLEIYSDGTSNNDSIIKSTNRSLYLESTGLTTSSIRHTANQQHLFYTDFSASVPQFTINEGTGVRVNASLVATATTSYGGSISARTDDVEANQVIPVIDFYRPVNTSNSDTTGSLKYFGANSSGQKSYYGEMLCKAVDTSTSGNQRGQLEWYVADGSGQTVPVTDVNADNTGKKLAMVVSDTYTGFYGGNQLYLEGVNSSGDKGYLNFGNYQSLRPPLTSDSSKIYLPQTDADKVISIGGIGATDSWIFGTTMSETDFLKYRGQHMVRYGTTATATATFDLPRVQATNSGHSTSLGNIGDIYTISNVVGGALTIDRDASGTAQAVYELNGSSLVAFTNNPTISVGGSITLQAVGTNTYLIMNAKGLTDA